MRTNVQVDCFDLSYGCLESAPYRLFDVAARCARLLAEDEIDRVRYREPLRVVREEPGLTTGAIECAAGASSGHDVVDASP